MLAVIEIEGYRSSDDIYYVRKDGIRKVGMSLIDGMTKD
jgi:hypothetical protein